MAMEVKESDVDLGRRLKERMSFCSGVASAATKQYLDSARGHYLSALAGKQERKNICDSAGPFSVVEDNDNALEHSAEAEEMSIRGQLDKCKSFAGVDTSLHSPNIVLKECDPRLQVKVAQFDKTPLKSTSEQIAEMISVIGGDSGHEMEPVTAELESSTTVVLPELIGVKGYPLKGPGEGVSLQKMVKSLKVELENLKKEHAELKDKGEGVGFDTRNLHFKLLKSKPEHEGKLAGTHASKRIPEDLLEEDGCKVEGKGLKRKYENPKFSGEMAKKHRVTPSFDKAKDTMLSNFDQNKCMPQKIYDTCVSTSESSVRLRFSEDELESSSQKAVKSDKPERNQFTGIRGQVDSAKDDLSSEFSIRDYVFAARNKDISTNWPFSQKNLQLCLKHGVKNVLPPFQYVDSMEKNSVKRHLNNTSLHSEESKLEERPLGQKRHVIPDSAMNHKWNPEHAEVYRDSDVFPCVGVKELGFKSTAMANSHSEVDSVSTNNVLLLSEVSDEQVASASASASAPAGKIKMKSCASPPSNNKCKVAVKMHFSTDDITSASTALSEAMASKICPVCQIFSSSSNTTLNAHIDQCLSSQSPPNWISNPKLVKPRIKPRKMRSMVDICATAPCCTLEDLDRRNGTNWATNSEFFSQDTDMVTQGKSCVSARHADNGAVYIDSSGRKIRILSKFNDISSSSLNKVEEDARPKKQSKLGKTSNFFSTKRKGRLGKHWKYLKVSQQRKMLSYRKIKGRLNEARGSAEATSMSGEKLVSEQQKASFVKASGEKNVSLSGTLKLRISSKRSNRSKKGDPKGINKPSRPASNNSQPGSDSLDPDMLARKPSRSPEKYLRRLRRGVRTRILCQTGSAQSNENSSGSEAFRSLLMEPSTQGNKDPSLVPVELGAVQFDGKEGVSKSVDSALSPASSIERQDEFQADVGENADSSFPNSRGLSDGTKSNNSETNMPQSVICIHAAQSSFNQKGLASEKSLGCGGEDVMGDTQSTEIRPHSDPLLNYQKICKIKNSLGHALRFCRERGFVHSQAGGSKKTCGYSDEVQDDHGCERSASAPISSPAFAEAVMDSKRWIDPESRNVVDVADPMLKSVQYFGPLPGPCQPSSSDDDEMFQGSNVRLEELKTQVCELDACQSLFPEVDPIPIPGPPGSDLPSFSDMGSEDLHRTSSSLNSSLAQSSGDGDDEVNGSPFSPASTVSNLVMRDDPTLLLPECSPTIISGSNNVHQGWYRANFGHTVGTSEMFFSQVAVTGRERTLTRADSSEDKINAHPISEECSQQQRSCSLKGEVPLNFEEYQALGQRMETLVAMPMGKRVGSTLDGRKNCLDGRNTVLPLRSWARAESENISRFSETSCQPMEVSTGAALSLSRRAGGCDSSNSGPILRLMGKDLMVVSKAKYDSSISRDQVVQNVCTNREEEEEVHSVSDFYSGFPKSWQHQPHEGMSCIGTLLYGQVPDIVSMQHLEDGTSEMMNNTRNPKQLCCHK